MTRAWRPFSLFLLASSLFGCSTEEPDLDVGAPYSVNGDCTQPSLACVFGACHLRCQTSAGCPTLKLQDQSEIEGRCVVLDRTPACLLGGEQECSSGEGCPDGLVCASDGLCRNDCVVSRECMSGQACTEGACLEIAESSDDAAADTGDTDAESNGAMSDIDGGDEGGSDAGLGD